MAKIVLAIILCSIMVSFCGCEINSIADETNNNDGYYAEAAQGEFEYTNFIGKKVQPVLTRLIAHATEANNIAAGETAASDEILNIDTSVGLIERAVKDFSAMKAANGYENVRLSIIRKMNNCINSLNEYKEALNSNSCDKTSLKEYATLFKNEFTMLQSEAMLSN